KLLTNGLTPDPPALRLVLAENFAELAGDLSEGTPGLGALQDEGHQVLRALRGAPERFKGLGDGRIVTLRPQSPQLLRLHLADGIVYTETGGAKRLLRGEAVHPDDHLVTRLQRPLIP